MPYIFTLGRLGNLSVFFLQEKIYVGHPRFHNFRVLGALECFYSSTLVVIASRSSREKKLKKKLLQKKLG